MGFFKVISEETKDAIRRHMSETSENRKKRFSRLEAIRKRMGLREDHFAELLGLTMASWRWASTKGECSLCWVKLAEYELEVMLSRKEGTKRRQRYKTEAAIPEKIREDVALKAEVFKLYLKGKTEAEITAELAIRPGVAAYFLGQIR